MGAWHRAPGCAKGASGTVRCKVGANKALGGPRVMPTCRNTAAAALTPTAGGDGSGGGDGDRSHVHYRDCPIAKSPGRYLK